MMNHTLILLGEFDRASAATLEAEIERACEAGCERITLDLSKLSYIDATGIAVISFRCALCVRRGHEFALIPGSPFVQSAFEQAGASERLPFVTTDAPLAAADVARAGAPSRDRVDGTDALGVDTRSALPRGSSHHGRVRRAWQVRSGHR
jgi:anti-anti-sigma factor